MDNTEQKQPSPYKRIQVIFNEKNLGIMTVPRDCYNALRKANREKNKEVIDANFSEVRRNLAARFGIKQAGRLWLYFPEKGDAILNN